MPYQSLVTSLTVASGSTTSNSISGSDVAQYEFLTIYSSASTWQGSASVQVSYAVASGSGAWANLQIPNLQATDIVLSPGRASSFYTIGCDGYRVATSLPQSQSMLFHVFAQGQVTLHAQF